MGLNRVSDLFYQVIKDMYAKTELCEKVDSNHTTDFFASDIGVCQGENLSLIFLNYL